MEFSNPEYADIVFVYGFCDGNAAEAIREYGRRFPDRILPSANVYSRTFNRLSETGTILRNQRSIGTTGRRIEVGVEERILASFGNSPTTSTRIVATRLGVSQWKVWSTLN